MVASPPAQRSIRRTISVFWQTAPRNLALAAAYFGAGWLGLLLAPPDLKISLIWLPTGIAVAALHRWGFRQWPGLLLGAFVLLRYSFPVDWEIGVIVLAGQTLGPLLAAWTLRRTGFHGDFTRWRDIGFLTASAFIGMAVSATGGAVALRLAGLLSAEDFGGGWLTWWLGDVMGVLALGPVLCSSTRESWCALARKGVEVRLFAGLMACVPTVIFFLPAVSGVEKLPLIFLPLLLAIWCALRFGTMATSLAVAVVAILAASGLAIGRGPFFHPGVINGVFLLWTYIGTLAVLSLMTAGIEVSRRTAARNFQESQAALLKANAQLKEAIAQSKEALNVKNEFLANISHEIRTPMNGILGMTELLLAEELNSTQREYAEVVHNSGGTLMRLLNDLLDLAKIEAGKVEIVTMDFDLPEMLTEVAQLARATCQPVVDLQLALAPDVPRWVHGDQDRLRQVLGNLLGNAVKFTLRGTVVLRVRTADQPQQIAFEVHDTGEGISPEQMKNLFQPFTQADRSTTRRFGGTGLGLAISRQLVELMGGTLEASSDLGKGSIFSFTLGFVTGKLTPPEAKHRSPDRSHPPAQQRILVVEDNPVNRKLALLQLHKLGCIAKTAENGRDALEKLAAGEFDLVLMDCQMPEMDGYEATRRIRAGLAEGVSPDIPIIALTANAMTADLEKCREAGMTDCLTKPVNVGQLEATIRRLLTEGPSAQVDREMQ